MDAWISKSISYGYASGKNRNYYYHVISFLNGWNDLVYSMTFNVAGTNNT